ncbi:MAG: phenylalanine--tRNA ligase subunit beta [Candidatus Margulisiibacteriota bacterium]
MLAPISWLKDYVDIKDTAEDLAYKLTMSSFEIEQIIYPAKDITGVVIGRIDKIEKHPNADKLRICLVNTSADILKIVTGAANVQEGHIVPVATVGAKLVGGFEIKPAKLRGEDSFGMLCSEKELGIADDAEGIMLLPDDAPIGEDLISYLGLRDAVLDISILPNRPDCMSIIGVAREVAAVLNVELNTHHSSLITHYSASKAETENLNEYVTIKVEDFDLCPRYMGRVMKNVTIIESPLWMQQRLKLAGIRPINSIVDITNYVLIEYGQPLHAFDYDRLANSKEQIANRKNHKEVVVRRAKKGEKMETLDGEQRELTRDNLVITDSSGPIALAGVMGGANSEIYADTKNVFLESAFFNPVSVRKTAQKLGYRTESSIRFERGVDWNGVEAGINRAAQLMAELAGAKVINSIADVKAEEPKNVIIDFRPERINSVLGMSLSEKEMKADLAKLGFAVNNNKIEVPSWRASDVTREADIIEEIARIAGYDKLPVTLPASRGIDLIDLQGESYVEKITRILLGQGLSEITTFSIVSPEMTAGDDEITVKITNPLNQEESVMRTSMFPSIMKVLQLNASRRIEDVRIFEPGKIYEKVSGAGSQVSGIINGNYRENLRIAGALMDKGHDFYQAKAVLENLFCHLKVEGIQFNGIKNNEESPLIASVHIDNFHPGKTAIIKINDQVIGVFGEVHPQLQQKYRLSVPVYYFDLDGDLIKKHVGRAAYKQISRYPSTTQDMAFMVKSDVAHADIVNTIKENSNYLVEDVKIFDRYEGEQIPEGWVSVAYSITYRDPEKTLVEKEVIKVHEKIAKAVQEKLGVKFR